MDSKAVKTNPPDPPLMNDTDGDGLTHAAPVALVTGASRGIGFAICSLLAGKGWLLIPVAHDRARLQQACSRLEQMHSGCVAFSHAVDLAEQPMVHELADRVIQANIPLRALVHNAGVIQMKRELTSNGMEKTWATNVVAPHVLTQRLSLLLPANPTGRVIFMSSMVERWGSLNLTDTSLSDCYTPDSAYNQSKLALRLLAMAWAERQPGWFSLSMEPGMTDTDFGSNYTGLRAWMRRIYRPFMETPIQAADTAVWLLTTDGQHLIAGGHFRKRCPVQMQSSAKDINLARQLIAKLDIDLW